MAFVDAYIEVEMQDFHPVTAGSPLQLSRALFRLVRAPDGGVRQDQDVFKVSRKARLVFYFPREDFFPQDLWFVQTDGGGDDPAGKENLKEAKPGTYGRASVEVKNHFIKNYGQWKILIPVVTARGQTGVIDPEIANVSDESITPPKNP